MATYTPEQQQAFDAKAEAAAKKEFESDPILAELKKPKPNHKLQQERVDAAISDLRKGWGLES